MHLGGKCQPNKLLLYGDLYKEDQICVSSMFIVTLIEKRNTNTYSNKPCLTFERH